MKTIKEQTIKAITGVPYQLPMRDEDGNPVFVKDYPEEYPLERRQVKMVDATTRSLVKHIITAMPREVQAPKDGFFSYQVMAQMEKSTGDIQLDDNSYSWLHRLLKARKMPHTKEQKDAGVLEMTYGRWLFGMSDYLMVVQLTDIDTTPEEPGDDK